MRCALERKGAYAQAREEIQTQKMCLDRTRARREKPQYPPTQEVGGSCMANEATQMHTLALSVSDKDINTGRGRL